MAEARKKYVPRRYRNRGGKISSSRIGWSDTVLGTTIIYRYLASLRPELTDEELVGISEPAKEIKEKTPTVRLFWKHPTLRRFSVNLTACTEQELDCLKKAIDLAFDEARPICRRRDEDARAAAAAGDDSDARTHRRLAQFVVRPGKISEHLKGIWGGHDTVPDDPYADPSYRDADDDSYLGMGPDGLAEQPPSGNESDSSSSSDDPEPEISQQQRVLPTPRLPG